MAWVVPRTTLFVLNRMFSTYLKMELKSHSLRLKRKLIPIGGLRCRVNPGQ